MSIAVRNLWFSFGRSEAVLRGLTFEVASGEIVGLLGPNGAGKTTTFKLIAGLMKPDDGTIHVCGKPVATASADVKRVLAFLPDRSLLYDSLSGEENMNMFGLLWGMTAADIRSRSKLLLEEAGLWDARRHLVNSYSAGMLQKLSFCAALLHQPKVLLIDEPFTAMDVRGAAWGRAVLANHAKNGGSVLFSTHQEQLVNALADRTIHLENGIAVPASADQEANTRASG